MHIGVIGLGVVGEAVAYGLASIGHKVVGHDPKNDTRLEQVLDCELVYVCVPTPSNPDGGCNTGVVESVVAELQAQGYAGVIAIKSTVIVGTTERLIQAHNNPRICFVPEFLRERCAVSDFIDEHDLLVVGTREDAVFDAIVTSHGELPKQVARLAPGEAEFCKYYNNVYNAHLITLANSMYEICKHQGLDYDAVRRALSRRAHISRQYLDCNDNLRGFAGVCLPKDLRALNRHQAELGLSLKLFQCLLDENERFGVSVLPGMRTH